MPVWKPNASYRALVAVQSFDGVEFLPNDLGFGIAWGEIKHEDDYYGNVINVAARLQDCARPRGVIVDSSAYQRRPAQTHPQWGEPMLLQKAKLKGVGPVTFRWIVRLTRRERASRRARQLTHRLAPALLPLLLFLW